MRKLILVQLIAAYLLYACQNTKNKPQATHSAAPADTVLSRYAFANTGLSSADMVNSKSDYDTINNKFNLRKASIDIPKTLKDAYKNYFPIGAALNTEIDLNNDTVARFVVQQYSSITPRRSMQPMKIHPKQNFYDWTEADKVVKFAQDNNMRIRGHCLVYYLDGHMPAWIYTKNGAEVSKDTLLQRLHDHINTVVSKYKGKVYCWDVVNEALSRNPGELFRSSGDRLYKIAGSDYVEKAFQYAREADPNAKLFYNEDFLKTDHFEKTFEYLKQLKKKGIPIDGIGIQCHLKIDGISAATLQKYIDAFSGIGLEVQLTELDISIYQKPSQDPESAYTPQIQEKQKEDYETIFKVCRKNKGKVTGITFWGYADDDGLNSLTQKLKKKNYPFLFDRQLKPKSFYNNIVNF